MKTIISITAKCSDLFDATLSSGDKVIGNYSGYVPNWMPEQHDGDYVILDIDAATGKILNWKNPTVAQFRQTFVKQQ